MTNCARCGTPAPPGGFGDHRGRPRKWCRACCDDYIQKRRRTRVIEERSPVTFDWRPRPAEVMRECVGCTLSVTGEHDPSCALRRVRLPV